MELHPVKTFGSTPSPRSSSVAALWWGRLVLFGGVGLKSYFNDVHSMDVATHEWCRWDCAGQPPQPRAGACGAVVEGESLVVFGGRGELNVFDDLWALDLQKREWGRPQIVGSCPPPREDAAMLIHLKRECVIYGGSNSTGQVLADMWVWNMRRSVWNCVMYSGDGPMNGLAASASTLLDEQTAVFFGGYDGCAFSNFFYLLNLADYVWQRLDVTGAVPRPRTHCAVATNRQGTVFLFGGYAGGAALGDVWSLRPTFSRVTLLQREAVASDQSAGYERGAASSVMLDDSSMLIVGGCDGSRFVETALLIGPRRIFNTPTITNSSRFVLLESPTKEATSPTDPTEELESAVHQLRDTVSNPQKVAILDKQDELEILKKENMQLKQQVAHLTRELALARAQEQVPEKIQRFQHRWI